MAVYLTAKQAADALDISLQTLYAYVSRGLIRSEPAEEGSRKRRYNAEDVRNLILKKNARSEPEKLAEAALHLGTPVTESELTLITEDALYYRGYDVAQLARTHSIEQIAGLLWLDDVQSAEWLFKGQQHPRLDELINLYQSYLPISTTGLDLLRTLQAVLALAGIDSLVGYDTQPEAMAQLGAHIMWLAVSVIAGNVAETAIADKLAIVWGQPEIAAMLNELMILCADHELNVSSFTARVVVSSHTDLFAVVVAALSALGGAKHGGITERVNALIREIEMDNQPRQTIMARIKRGDRLPGFGHPLYSQGDPRAKAALTLLEDRYAHTTAFQQAQEIIDIVQSELGLQPNIDFALSTSFRVMEVDPMYAVMIFALGRFVGWIAQAIEQTTHDKLIRPRATYVGRIPQHDRKI